MKHPPMFLMLLLATALSAPEAGADTSGNQAASQGKGTKPGSADTPASTASNAAHSVT